MKKIILGLLSLFLLIPASADQIEIRSPDNNLVVAVALVNGSIYYSVTYKEKTILEDSPLGLITNVSDFSRDLQFVEKNIQTINKTYADPKIKKSTVTYGANEVTATYRTSREEKISLIFRVSNNDIAFKYALSQNGETARCTVERELTGFNFPSFTTTFLTPQATPMIGWMKTKPSYEEVYVPDEPVGTPSKYGVGYTFPGLFHVGDRGWALVSETGVGSLYCGSKLSEGTKEGLYTVAFPEEGENNGIGSANPSISLPGETPWRTITIGDNLKPIVETTIAFDVVEPLYEPSIAYQFGRSTWSWLLWQDGSINVDDQRTFIDLSSTLGYELVLIDNWWDTRIGREKIEELAHYAASKDVGISLWYNSNGFWSDAPQGPKNKMNRSVARKKEMAWLQSIGAKGIKVDFFGGDKQETLKLYEDILSDANDYGLAVIFHGCTLPRGWEIMYPNFAGSEAVLASENLIFSQHANDQEAFNATLHPFIRNSVASMDFGPVLLNKQHNQSNDGGNRRRTTEIFQLATAVLFQTPIQHFGMTPNNLQEYPQFVIDFMKEIPTLWDETLYIDGYPGKYVVLARRHANKWYMAAINAEKEVKKMDVTLPMLAGKSISLYSDKKDRSAQFNALKIKENGRIALTIEPGGGVIITNQTEDR
ncbi:MAG: alpha-glucosidase [Bacteroidetes bacterium GWD2_45_23]|nr:MAG: alpha-glucosidase [Bacteroidetes bacterium GWC2_46_850]OFX65737.1 MAG: alpha-glucosidase [Bacteroidetes bacterium GWC1_47_7]OFX85091.1 MAG: alpha-glucosidase [Bacteroidetes bacterium GWD2_45_23]HAR39658.1 alpha-glucosidase [Porphyromonadaceae bacterium]HBB00408.1 alpha-glucosidase [Porphyromonadaceae bacterium]